VDASGVYRVNLFLDLKWQEIEIDDQLPIICNTIMSTWCNTLEPWPALLEKALAKIVGGFEYLSILGHGFFDEPRKNKEKEGNNSEENSSETII